MATTPVVADFVRNLGGDRIALTQIIKPGVDPHDTSAELSGRDLSALVATLRAAGVKAVFSESSLPPRTAETVAREAGIQVVGGEESLYADGLGPEDSPGGTYLGAERHNTDTIVKALGGRV